MKLSRRKMLDKHLSKRVLRALYKDCNFADCYQIACNASKEQPYLVGGKLFRTLIEVLYEYPARAGSCDYDFATTSILKRKKKKRIRKRRVDETEIDYIRYKNDMFLYLKKIKAGYSGESRKISTRNGAKIDIIDIASLEMINDGSYPTSIDGYLLSVPLSIQSLAMDIGRCEIFGSVGIDSINEKFLWINNKESVKKLCGAKKWKDNGYSYIDKKAKSIRFRHDVTKPKPKLSRSDMLSLKSDNRWWNTTISTSNNMVIGSSATTTSNGSWYTYTGTT